ncbi:hypothetical protein BDK51DRAFT_48332 [Blyttiomyces helicus]|uniref:Dynamin N-terminal domain-containing protein n=1 Tax=Blyttiomyces helicus TaxID=388810 RepID=A0A4P9WFL9_9FUNG|nr:hypothetical protein BDK51DRAFT_48332 [Blyttiomyces helicus]|eukprot:RKO91202.1 hypothetical protein BDK51DRAFT_48332 [Blyttiomyces helicus]
MPASQLEKLGSSPLPRPHELAPAQRERKWRQFKILLRLRNMAETITEVSDGRVSSHSYCSDTSHLEFLKNFGRWESLFSTTRVSEICNVVYVWGLRWWRISWRARLIWAGLTSVGPGECQRRMGCNLRCIVVGNPSSGKPSVVEAISGIALPHSHHLGCVTEVRMKKGPSGSTFAARVFTGAAGSVVHEFSSLSGIASIVRTTLEDLAHGESNTSVADPIIVEITSPDLLDLTIVGPRRGRRSRRIQLASQEVRCRSARCAPYDRGRSQTDIDEGLKIDEANNGEVELFMAHPELRIITDNVSEAGDLLELFHRVAQLRLLANIKERIGEAIQTASARLAKLGPDPVQSVGDKRACLAKVWGIIAEVLADGATGRYSHPIFNHPDLLLRGRADALSEDFEATISVTKPEFRTSEYADKLLVHESKIGGSRPPGSINSALFDYRPRRSFRRALGKRYRGLFRGHPCSGRRYRSHSASGACISCAAVR